MMENNTKYIVIPLHHRPDLITDCCKLLNSEWPRSENARMKSLNVSCDNFPTCLILVNAENKVLGHCKVSLVTKSKVSCFIESVVIDYRCRSRGLGSRLLRGMEEYVAKRGLKNIYLKTDGQEVFYFKNGYKVCDPFKAYGINDIITASPPFGRTKFREQNGDHSARQPLPPPPLPLPLPLSSSSLSLTPPPPPPPMPAFQLSKFFDMRMLSKKTHMKSAAEAHRLLVEAYGEAALSDRSCREWFQKFKNGEFDVEDKKRSGRPKVYEDAELETLLEEDSCQTQEELALTLGVTQPLQKYHTKNH